MVEQKKAWSDMSSEETAAVFASLKKVYDEEPLASKISVSIGGEYVHDLV